MRSKPEARVGGKKWCRVEQALAEWQGAEAHACRVPCFGEMEGSGMVRLGALLRIES